MHTLPLWDIAPGATVVLSHVPRATYAVRRVLVRMPPMFDEVRLELPPHGPLPLSDPRVSDFAEGVVSWLVLGPNVWVTPQHTLQLYARNPGKESARLYAMVSGDER